MCDSQDSAMSYLGLLSETVSCKKAIIVQVFFTYLMYVGVVAAIYLIEYKWPEEKRELAQKLKAFKLDVEQKQFFTFAFALLAQIQAPTPFPVVWLYLYLITYGLLVAAHFKQDKWAIKLVTIIIQQVFQLILIFYILINPWCRFYYFRYIVGVPSDSYYPASSQYQQTSTSQSQPSPTQSPQSEYIPPQTTSAPYEEPPQDNSTIGNDTTDFTGPF